jgi:hypothetical protein
LLGCCGGYEGFGACRFERVSGGSGVGLYIVILLVRPWMRR